MASRETPRPPDEQASSERAFERFQLETEPMGDGRLIHYYRWPAAEPELVTDRESAPSPPRPDV